MSHAPCLRNRNIKLDSEETETILQIYRIHRIVPNFLKLSFIIFAFDDIEDFMICCPLAVKTDTIRTLNEPRHENTCFCHMRTTKAQISLRIRAV